MAQFVGVTGPKKGPKGLSRVKKAVTALDVETGGLEHPGGTLHVIVLKFVPV